METVTVAALKRASLHGTGFSPGQTVRYVVVDADGTGAGRVRLAHEHTDRYDHDWYADAAVRAIESILAPIGWHEADIRDSLIGTTDTTLHAYTEGSDP